MMNGEVSAQYWAFGIYFFVGMGICLLMIMLAALLGESIWTSQEQTL